MNIYDIDEWVKIEYVPNRIIYVKPGELAKISIKDAKSISYLKDSVAHNDRGPAFILFDPDGKVRLVKFYVNGKLHRDNGAAFILIEKARADSDAEFQYASLHKEYHNNGTLIASNIIQDMFYNP